MSGTPCQAAVYSQSTLKCIPTCSSHTGTASYETYVTHLEESEMCRFGNTATCCAGQFNFFFITFTDWSNKRAQVEKVNCRSQILRGWNKMVLSLIALKTLGGPSKFYPWKIWPIQSPLWNIRKANLGPEKISVKYTDPNLEVHIDLSMRFEIESQKAYVQKIWKNLEITLTLLPSANHTEQNDRVDNENYIWKPYFVNEKKKKNQYTGC